MDAGPNPVGAVGIRRLRAAVVRPQHDAPRNGLSYRRRLSSHDVLRVGNVAGRLYALSTAGSIFGTLFTAFYWLNLSGVRAITTCIGWSLVATGVLVLMTTLIRGRTLRASILRGVYWVRRFCWRPLWRSRKAVCGIEKIPSTTALPFRTPASGAN